MSNNLAIADDTLRRALIDSIGRLDTDQLKTLLAFITSELAGYPWPEEGHVGNSDEHFCKQLIKQLSEDETLSVLQWILNLLRPIEVEIDTQLKDLQQFCRYDLSLHYDYLGVKKIETPSDFLGAMKSIALCLKSYRNKLSDLENSVVYSINTLSLIAESEDVLQSGNWSTSKTGCLTVMAIRLAVESRDRLRRSHQEFKGNVNNRSEEFDSRDVDDIPF